MAPEEPSASTRPAGASGVPRDRCDPFSQPPVMKSREELALPFSICAPMPPSQDLYLSLCEARTESRLLVLPGWRDSHFRLCVGKAVIGKEWQPTQT